MDYLPVFLRLQSRPALVVGGGPVAARKADWLLRAGAHVTVVAPRLSAALAARAARAELVHVAEAFAPAHLAGAAVAVAASGDRGVNAAVSQAARAQGVPVNVVDSPELSSFIFPAIIDRSPVVVAVSSAGASPVLARSVRAQIEALLPARLGALARFLGARRTAVQRALGPGARRAFWERFLTGRGAGRVLAGEQAAAQRCFARELRAAQPDSSAAGSDGGRGEVYLIGAGPGDPDLLTLRALQLLQQADVLLYDRLVPEAILERARRDAQRVFVGKETGDQTQQTRINELLVSLARAGKRVARLKGGDPYVFGRGGEELEVLAAHGIPYRVVPGITAALGAAAAADIPLTHRRLAHSVTLVSGHAALDDSLDWHSLARPHQTVVFYMGVAQLPRIVARLRGAGARPDLPAAVLERATLPGQRVLRAPLAALAALVAREHVAAPALLIVGEVAALADAARPGELPGPYAASSPGHAAVGAVA
ncbi:MAG TPA: siroheme synthase CysG [Steroidobacteraceae bacterium]|nr:siroheme synthase CysG [Steroidobacteraceae bacterium]